MILGLALILVGFCIFFIPRIYVRPHELHWIDAIGTTCCGVLYWGVGVTSILFWLIEKELI
jgi:hypothetical protein